MPMSSSKKEYFKVVADTFKTVQRELMNSSAEYLPDDYFEDRAEQYTEKFVKRHGYLKILGRIEKIPLAEIYTNLEVLHKTLKPWPESEGKTRSLGTLKKEKLSQLDIINKDVNLVVLGKTGAGKSVFLRYAALQAISGKIKNQRVPVLINLDDSEKTIVDYIIKEFDVCGFSGSKQFTQRMLEKGSFLLLFYGLEKTSGDSAQKIKAFSQKYKNCIFIITHSPTEYNYCFEGFTDVEILGFGDREIRSFVEKWFKSKPEDAMGCLDRLLGNAEVKELCRTPLFLSMCCLLYSKDTDFPQRQTALYEEAFACLLRKWDTSKNIKRGEVYRYLSVKQKQEMFAKIAYDAFEKDKEFLTKDLIEKSITEFIKKLDIEGVEFNSVEILKELEFQHGIVTEYTKNTYVFYNQSFYKYFVAKYITEDRNEKSFDMLLDKLSPRSRESFLVSAEMSKRAEVFFLKMKKHADSFSVCRKIQEVLLWAEKKASLVKSPYPAVSVRAFYLSTVFAALSNCFNFVNPLAKSLGFGSGIDVDLSDELIMSRSNKFLVILNLDRSFSYIVNLLTLFSNTSSNVNSNTCYHYDLITRLYGKDFHSYLDSEIGININLSLRLSEFVLVDKLYKLKKRIPDKNSPMCDWVRFRDEIRSAAVEHMDVAHDFNFSNSDIKFFESYVYSNNVLADSLNNGFYVSKYRRQEIFDNMLLSDDARE